MAQLSRQEQRHNCAEQAITSFNPITFEDTKEIFIYNGESGLYEPGETQIETYIQSFFLEDTKTNDISETLGIIRRKTYVKRKEILNQNLNLIPLENGVFDLENRAVLPYTKDMKLLYKHHVFFDKNADCHEINKFLESSLEKNEKKLLRIKKMIGYCFLRHNKWQKAFMLIGKGQNGKSKLLSLLREALGNEQVATETLQELTENRFAAGRLYLKNANIFADLEKRALKTTGIFKALVGEDALNCEKKFKDAFSFENYAKLLFSCNQPPKTNDNSDAFYRRWCIVVFSKQFLNEEKDNDLWEKISTQQEISGFFNDWVLGGIEVLEKEGFPDEIDETREFYERASDITKAFCYDCLQLDLDAYERKEIVWSAYLEYCKQNDALADTEKSFYRVLVNHFEGKVYSTRKLLALESERAYIWQGIRLVKKED